MKIATRRAKHDCQDRLRVVISYISKNKYAIIAIRILSLSLVFIFVDQHTDFKYTLQKSSLKVMKLHEIYSN